MLDKAKFNNLASFCYEVDINIRVNGNYRSLFIPPICYIPYVNSHEEIHFALSNI